MSTDATGDRAVIVQKFGGTSVVTTEGRAALRARVRQARDNGLMPVVVVSAMGRSGAPYATDTLLGLLDGYEADPREADLLASCGEVVSAVIIAHELRAEGVPATAMTGAEAGVLTDACFGDATVLGVEPEFLRSALRRGEVPVVTGFQGVTTGGQTTTLGRGGSDTSACAIAAALGATAVEIYTDVDGVMTADPRAFAGARVLDSLQFEELFQMAKAGAKVIHAPAAEVANSAGVPLRVRNTYTDAPGTLVADTARLAADSAKRIVTAVSHSDGVARAIVALPVGDRRNSALTELFLSMADAGVSLDMFTPLGDALALSFDESCLDAVSRALGRLGLDSDVQTGLSTVTLVGAGMHGVPGVMARIAGTLATAGIEILQIADSHYTISVLLDGRSSRTAIASLHDEFGLSA